jgi:hypothetical protein
MIEQTLASWTAADLAHDLHHGGELALMLGMQGIAVPELGDLGGHLTVSPLAESS